MKIIKEGKFPEINVKCVFCNTELQLEKEDIYNQKIKLYKFSAFFYCYLNLSSANFT
jgi:hypothetical protein